MDGLGEEWFYDEEYSNLDACKSCCNASKYCDNNKWCELLSSRVLCPISFIEPHPCSTSWKLCNKAPTDFQYYQKSWKIIIFIWLSTEQRSIIIQVMFSLITKDQLKRHPRHSPHTLLYYFYLKFIDKFPSQNIYRFVITRLFVFVCLTSAHCPSTVYLQWIQVQMG